MNKKASSEIITAVVLITIGILSVTIVWVIINNTIKQVQLSPEQFCLFENNPLAIQTACYNQETSDLEIKISRDNFKSRTITQFTFLIDSGKETSSWNCGNCNSCKVLESGEKTYFISQEKKPEKVSIALDSCTLVTKGVKNCEV